jgi:glutamate formiminotransferase/formiminotetrahydrofolate cyclodeaminase
MRKLIECVPNFSEGRDMTVIDQITAQIKTVAGISLLDVDPGKATNRTVVTFVGEPEQVVEAAYKAIRKAAELIDMSTQSGEHPRFGATDVCPFIPVSGANMEDCIACANALGQKLDKDGDIPAYLYEAAASSPQRKNLAKIRAGEYEGIAEKIVKPEWKPDFGPAKFNPKTGNVAIGARDFLVAFNVNLNTTSTKRANSVAFDVREAGRVKREGDPITGSVIKDENGVPLRQPGLCKAVKGIGWYIEEYGVAQISMNLTNLVVTPVHKAFDACNNSAHKRGLRVTGSELVGLIPLNAMLDAGRFFLQKQDRSLGVSDAELIRIAVKSMGLDELYAFDPHKKIIEYMIDAEIGSPLADMSLRGFADETASESPAPGGGSVSAYVGALGAALGTMVANLSANKRGWEARWEEFSNWAEIGQSIKKDLVDLVDEDTRAFSKIMDAFRMPKGSDAEKQARLDGIQAATKYAIETPFRVMERCLDAMPLMKEMAKNGNPNSVSDAAVGAICIRAGIEGAFLNVKINADGLEDKAFIEEKLKQGEAILAEAKQAEAEVLKITNEVISK